MNQRRLATGATRLLSRLRLRRWLIPLAILLALPLTLIDTAAQNPVNTGNRELFDDTVPQFVRTPAMRTCPITLGVGESMDISLGLVPLADRIASHVNPADVPDVAHALVGVHATPAMYHLPLVVALSGGQSTNTAESITFQVTPGAPHSYMIRGNAQGSDSLLRLSRYYWDDGGGNSTPATFISAQSYRVNVIAPFTYDPRPTPTVRFRRSTETITEGQTLTFRVDVHPPPTEDLNMLYNVQDELANTSTAFWYRIPARCASFDLTIPTADNDVAEDDRNKRVDLIAMSGYVVDPQGMSATAMVVDDDQLTTVFDDSRLKIAGTASASYGVKLNKQPQSDVTVNISATNPDADDAHFDIVTGGTDEAPEYGKSHSLQFTTSNWEEPQRVTIRGTAKETSYKTTGNASFRSDWYNMSLKHEIAAGEIVKRGLLPMEFWWRGGPLVRLSVPADGATEATIYSPAAVVSDHPGQPTSVTLQMCVGRNGYDHGFTIGQPQVYYAHKPAESGKVVPITRAIGKSPVTFDQTSYADRKNGKSCQNITVTAIDLTKTEIDDIHCWSYTDKTEYVGRGQYGILGSVDFRLTVTYPNAHYTNSRTCPTPYTGYPGTVVPTP